MDSGGNRVWFVHVWCELALKKQTSCFWNIGQSICLNWYSTPNNIAWVCLTQQMTHHWITIWLSHCKELSLCRQHFDEDRVCFGELQDPPMTEEVAAAHSSTQQPVSRQKADSVHSGRQEAYLNTGCNRLLEVRLGEVMRRRRRPGNDRYEKKKNWLE